MIYLGFNQVRFERWADAEPVLRRCLELRTKFLEPEAWQIGGVQSLLGATLVGLGKFDEAEPLLISGYTIQKAQQEKMPANARAAIQQALQRLIDFYEKRAKDGDREQAQKWKADLQPPAGE